MGPLRHLTKSVESHPPSLADELGPARWRGRAPASARGSSTYTESSGTHDGVFNLAPSRPSPNEWAAAYDGVEPGHTLRFGGSRSEGAHAVEFSKTVAPLQEGASFRGGAPSAESAIWDGLMSIAPSDRSGRKPGRLRRTGSRPAGDGSRFSRQRRTGAVRPPTRGRPGPPPGASRARPGAARPGAVPGPPTRLSSGPERSPCGCGGGRRSRAARPAARCRARSGRPRGAATPTDR